MILTGSFGYWGGTPAQAAAVDLDNGGTAAYDAATGAATTETSTAWVSNASAIAVGNGSTTTRQITGVAAGSEDTDAVNLPS